MKDEGRPHEGGSPDAEHRGGSSRRSDEATVMEGGAKGMTCLTVLIGQPAKGGTSEYCKPH